MEQLIYFYFMIPQVISSNLAHLFMNAYLNRLFAQDQHQAYCLQVAHKLVDYWIMLQLVNETHPL